MLRPMELSRVPWRLRYRTGRRLASAVRRVRLQLLHGHCTLRFDGPVYVGPGFSLEIPGKGTFHVGENVHFRRGFTCEIAGDGVVTIGARTVFTYDTVIQCSTRIDIGRDCMIGRSVIVDGNHRFRDPTVPIRDQGYDFRRVRIGDGTAVTSGAVVTASVGDGCFVAANAVVTKPMESYALVGGIPARVIERFGPSEMVSDTADPVAGG